MAKTQIKNFIFEPGLGTDGNLYPNAYALINSNRQFIISEATAYINQEIIDSVKCKRDVEYFIDGLAYDVGLGTNYNAIFLGLIELNSLDLSKTVFRTIERTKVATLALSAVSSSATATSRATTFWNEVVDIATNGRSAANAITYTNPSTATASQIAAKDKLLANIDFLAAEINAWVNVTYPAGNHDAAKYAREVKYAIWAAAYDVLYGGNSATYNSAKSFNYSTSSSIQAQTLAAYRYLQSIVDNIVIGSAITKSVGNAQTQVTTGTNASAGDAIIVANLIDIVADVIESGTGVLPTKTTPSVGWVSAELQAAKLSITNAKASIVQAVTWDSDYTYTESKCRRDVGYVLDAYLNDLRYSGDEKLYNTLKYYWDNGVAQIDGNRLPEIDAHNFIGDLIADYILTNTVYDKLGVVSQVVDLTKTAESAGVSALASLVAKTVGVLTDGIDAFGVPTHNSIGTIKIQGRYNTDELLLITNVTDNLIIYNFSDATSGAIVEIKDYGSDEDFPKYLQTTDAVTIIKLKYNTSNMSSTDELQIFVEKLENGKSIVTQRPYDFGTDAIERMRIATPQSMLDADFEYGLQPTKWSAIGMMRGYPSIYEIPGTDTGVLNVITDASSGSEGVGASLITVTTVTPHGFTIGTPITIKALETSVSGAARAEGSFVIIEIPSPTSFTYYAKAKVGTSAGQELSAGYTQLRQGGFYTGAGIEGAEFTVVSNGSSGVMFVELQTQSGSNTIPYDGNTPEIGSPLTNDNIPVGSQVTSVISNSGGGGEYLTLDIGENASTGDAILNLADATGVEANLALDRGDGTAIFINNIVGNTIELSGQLAQDVISNTKVYTAVSADTVQPVGTGLLLNITRSGGSYTLDSIFGLGGFNHKVGDRFKILGDALGGEALTHDLSGEITGVNASGGVTSVSISGTAINGVGSYTNLGADYIGGVGTDALFFVDINANAYTVTVPGGPSNISTGYIVGDRLRIIGSVFGGVDGTNDLIIEVTGVDAGKITSVNSSGTAPNADVLFENVVYTYAGAGTSATFDVRMVGTAYTAFITNAGAGYTIGETFTVSGGVLNGAPTTNDATITIDNVGGSNEILAISVSGTGSNTESFNNVLANNLLPAGATFDVDLAASAYTVNINAAGANYFPGQQVKILGSALQGTTPANDLTITVSTVNGTGGILTFTSSGTGSNGTVSYTEVQPTFLLFPGANAAFNITRSGGQYSPVTIANAGIGYEAGTGLRILGSALDGTDSIHDLLITIDTVSAGAIATFTITSATAEIGTQIPLICTFTMTEATTAPLAVNDSISFSAIATLEVLFDNAHGLVPGDTFIVAVGSDTGVNNHNLANGAFLAIDIPTTSSLRYIARAPGTITTAGDNINGTIYARPDSFFTHRPFDGGVQLGTGGPQHGAQAIRQSKKYIRYQSGKGIMYTTGALFAPSYDLRSVTATGTEINSLITVTTDDNDHGVQAGGVIRLLGIETPGYNSGKGNSTPPWFDYTVQEVLDERRFTVRAQRRLGNTTQLVLTPSVAACPLLVAYGQARLGTNTNDIHNFLINELAPDGYAWGDVNQSSSLTIDDSIEVGNYLNGVSQTETLRARIELMINELIARRNTGAIEDIIGACVQQADIGFGAQMSVVSWHGATVRSGIFDDQNGIYWEYDGTNISVNQRTGTQQVAGTISVNRDSNLITGTNSRFRDQLTAGDRIIVRGMTHVVTHVNSQTSMTVNPDFRGVNNITGAKLNLVVEKKVKQSEFNLDRLDGTGPSGYDIDIAKMQMIGIQYSWYGAGFIDFMLRGSDGNFVFCHRMRNSNVNTEAFMRSGNLPVRYEVTNEGPPGKLSENITAIQTTVPLVDGSFFPTSGTVYIDNEIVQFTGRSGNTLTGCIRGGNLTNFQAGAERTYSAGAATTHLAKTGVILISSTITPLISHWGSAFLTDGGFDEDRGYIFSYAETGVEVSTTKQTAFMIRLAPSVSNAIIGDLGERELLNRAQLLLQSLEVTSDGTDESDAIIRGGIVIEGVLNPQNYPINPSSVGWGGLSGVAQGGQPSFAQIAGGGSIEWTTGEAAVLRSATAQGTISAQINSGIYRSPRNNNYVYIDTADYQSTFGTTSGSPVIGKAITGSMFATGTTITEVYISGTFGYFRLSRNTSNTTNQNTTNAFTITSGGDLVNKNTAFFTKASFETAGAGVGTRVTSGGSVGFVANSLVNNVSLETFADTQYYEVQFNNSFTGTLTAGSGTVEFEFVQPPYAQPGETVFSFIAVPGERATTSFAELKELTNTALGGRGTFPNGPDVLAINVYKVSGANVTANLILKWGEAQA